VVVLAAAVFLIPLLNPGEGEDTGIEKSADPLEGFVSLFNGEDLTGWRGGLRLVDRRRKGDVDPKPLLEASAPIAKQIWHARNGAIVLEPTWKNARGRPRGVPLATVKEYRNFELLLDWKIDKGGVGCIGLRGLSQVRIWDSDNAPAVKGKVRGSGSGGLTIPAKADSKLRQPRVRADKPVGEWNTFRIVVDDDKATVYLNDKLVVDRQPLRNSLDAREPLPWKGPVELLHRRHLAWFRNLYIKELPAGGKEPSKPARVGSRFEGTPASHG